MSYFHPGDTVASIPTPKHRLNEGMKHLQRVTMHAHGWTENTPNYTRVAHLQNKATKCNCFSTGRRKNVEIGRGR